MPGDTDGTISGAANFCVMYNIDGDKMKKDVSYKRDWRGYTKDKFLYPSWLIFKLYSLDSAFTSLQGEYLCLAGVYLVKTGVPRVKPP